MTRRTWRWCRSETPSPPRDRNSSPRSVSWRMHTPSSARSATRSSARRCSRTSSGPRRPSSRAGGPRIVPISWSVRPSWRRRSGRRARSSSVSSRRSKRPTAASWNSARRNCTAGSPTPKRRRARPYTMCRPCATRSRPRVPRPPAASSNSSRRTTRSPGSAASSRVTRPRSRSAPRRSARRARRPTRCDAPSRRCRRTWPERTERSSRCGPSSKPSGSATPRPRTSR